jgi:hypothetical protein
VTCGGGVDPFDGIESAVARLLATVVPIAAAPTAIPPAQTNERRTIMGFLAAQTQCCNDPRRSRLAVHIVTMERSMSIVNNRQSAKFNRLPYVGDIAYAPRHGFVAVDQF